MEPIVKFWMVWRMGGPGPTYKHLTKELARREASRLAEKCPGETFVVLAAVDACKCPLGPVQGVKLRKATEEEILDSEIPF
jgi:hypothetical protein